MSLKGACRGLGVLKEGERGNREPFRVTLVWSEDSLGLKSAWTYYLDQYESEWTPLNLGVSGLERVKSHASRPGARCLAWRPTRPCSPKQELRSLPVGSLLPTDFSVSKLLIFIPSLVLAESKFRTKKSLISILV